KPSVTASSGGSTRVPVSGDEIETGKHPSFQATAIATSTLKLHSVPNPENVRSLAIADSSLNHVGRTRSAEPRQSRAPIPWRLIAKPQVQGQTCPMAGPALRAARTKTQGIPA